MRRAALAQVCEHLMASSSKNSIESSGTPTRGPELRLVQGNSSPDFGWRLGGRIVRSLPDRTVHFSPEPRERPAFLSPWLREGGVISACLQCGVCTASCDLVKSDEAFP